MKKTDLSTYDNSRYSPKAGWIKRIVWYFTSQFFFNNGFFPFSSVKVLLLRIFGAKVGSGVYIKPFVNIKYPWLLKVGDNAWIGEYVWIDNLTMVQIGNNVCLSQGAMLLTGNHNYKLSTFDLMVGEIILEAGVWIAARSVVCPGVTCSSHSVLSVKSVATQNMESYGIYQGNPAVKVRVRVME